MRDFVDGILVGSGLMYVFLWWLLHKPKVRKGNVQ